MTDSDHQPIYVLVCTQTTIACASNAADNIIVDMVLFPCFYCVTISIS